MFVFSAEQKGQEKELDKWYEIVKERYNNFKNFEDNQLLVCATKKEETKEPKFKLCISDSLYF